MTHGTEHTIKCPYCRKPAAVLSLTASLQLAEIREFTRPCPHCGKTVYYWARWSVTVEAEREERVR